MKNLLLIFLGSGLGATIRHTLSIYLQSHESKIPFGILACNLSGCLIIGLSYGYLKSHHPDWISPLAITGFLGGFTTFSTFALDTQKIILAGNWGTAITYILISTIGGIALCYIGFLATTRT